MSPDLVGRALSTPAGVLGVVLVVLLAVASLRRAARHTSRPEARSGAVDRAVRVDRPEGDTRARTVGWVTEAFTEATSGLDEGVLEVRVLGSVGAWERDLVDSFGFPVRVEVVRGESSTVFVGSMNFRRAKFIDPATGDVLRVLLESWFVDRPAYPKYDLASFQDAVRAAVVDESDGGVPNADVARLDQLLEELPADVSERLVEDGHLLRSRVAALALLDAVESGTPLEWALRRAGAGVA